MERRLSLRRSLDMNWTGMESLRGDIYDIVVIRSTISFRSYQYVKYLL